MKKIYGVLRADDRSVMRTRHTNLPDALLEAQRLAILYATDFYVLETIGAYGPATQQPIWKTEWNTECE
jgi:hypothetical protein